MSELGQVLQRAREEKNISLDDVQRVTKIQRRYLEAIERGHYHLLPGHFYARAFIKSYAEAVGLEPNDLLAHFQTDLPAQPPQEQMARLRRRRAASKEPLQSSRWVTQTLLGLFVALVIGVIYMAFVNRTPVDTSPLPGNTANDNLDMKQPSPNMNITPPPAATIPPTTTNPAGQATPPPSGTDTLPPATTDGTTVEKPVLSFVSQQGSQYVFSVEKADKLSIKLVGTDKSCWTQVREKRGGKKLDETTIKKGDEKVIAAGSTAYIVLGNPTAVQLSINDNPVDMSKLTFFPSNVSVTIKQAQ
ncbi:helix-turn-helix domain-containing protein [Brevibacillus fluminis]|uniref:Helix-turn-helix domain-containing protein n=1 Tax=Brevibacillus fluminis TaxID=511487 RepID=A0A3M8DUE1_9BACL|nr:RodZ domain-containing protein [Brevibacillus fluminis]RNB91800.1 helix-turn-helix domain-containing protein [Brevibacillus fluminis]